MSTPPRGMVGAEIVRAIFGAYRLAHFDSTGLAYFNNTVEGFWRSFIAAALAAPAAAIMVILSWSLAAEAGEPLAHGILHSALVEALTYVIAWTAFPLAMHFVCEIAGWRDRYIAYIVALNWANLFEIAILLPVFAIAAGGLLPAGLTVLIQFAVYGFIVAYEIFVARRALQIAVLPAVGVVVGGLALSFAVRALGDSIL
ncbi:MAG: hypothetical protein O3A96_00700 [Proteobacteria bacterium]|nr:hypothetical protein [Pseudomonadota bacterium]